MHKRPRNRWLDIQVILASLAVTFSLGLWNVFAKGSRPLTSTITPPTPDPTSTFTFTPAPDPTATPTVDPSAPLHLPKVHLLLGGSMPVAPVVQAASSNGSSAGSSKTQNNAQKGGGSNPASAPPPVTNTGSSKP